MKNNTKLIFTPYYINQSRLFDIYAIINDGYNEYSEISESVSKSKDNQSAINTNVAASGFKIFKFDLGGEAKRFRSSKNSSNQSHRKVQTTASMLSLVRNELEKDSFLKEITKSNVGDFVEIPVKFKFNSYKHLMSELDSYLNLYNSLLKINNRDIPKATIKDFDKIKKDFDKINDLINQLFSGDELLNECREYAVIANFYDSNLYQSSRSDLINTELRCLAQVKKVFPDGTQLMQNTTFSKIKEESMKDSFLDALSTITNQESVGFDSSPVSQILNKPVYQIEIIALYQ